MNPRVTVGLLAILVALTVYVYYGAPPSSPSSPLGDAPPGAGIAPPKTPDPALDIWTVDESQIQEVTVKTAGQEAGIRREGDGWVLTPSGEPGDRLRINSLIFRLASVKATRRLPDAANLDAFGLATPSLVGTLRLASGETRTLTAGAKAPAESGTYALKDGDTAVYLISNALAQDLERIVTEPPRPPTPTPLASPSPSPAP